MNISMMMMLLPTNPLIWILVLAVFFLLFGTNRISKLVRALGQSRRAWKEGLSDPLDEEKQRN